MSIDARLIHLGIQLPPTPAPGGIYTPVVVVDKMAYVSGQVPYGPDGKLVTGRIGAEMTEEEGADWGDLEGSCDGLWTYSCDQVRRLAVGLGKQRLGSVRTECHHGEFGAGPGHGRHVREGRSGGQLQLRDSLGWSVVWLGQQSVRATRAWDRLWRREYDAAAGQYRRGVDERWTKGWTTGAGC